MKSKFKWHHAFLVIIMAGIMIGFARGGLMSSGGLFLTSVSNDLGVGVGTLSLYFSISAIAMMLVLPITGKLIGKVNLKLLIIVSIIMQGGAFAVMGLLTKVWQFYAVSIIMAIGTAIPCQVIGPVLVNRWFKKNNGLAMGAMMALSGLVSAVIQPQIGLSIVNNGWRETYIGVGFLCAVIVATIALLFVKLPSNKEGRQPYGVDNGDGSNVRSDNHLAEGISVHIAKKSTSFFALFGFMVMLTAIASFSQMMPSFAVSHGYDIAFGGSAMGMLMIGTLIGGLFFGILSDKIGAKSSVLISLAMGLVSISMLVIGANNSSIFYGAMILFGFMNSSMGTMGPILVSSIFGTKNYAPIYATVAMGLAIGGMIGTPLFGFIFDKTNSFTLVLYLIIGMILLCGGLIMVAFQAKSSLWEKEKSLVNITE